MELQSIGLILISSFFHGFWNVLTQSSENSQFLSGLKGLWIVLLALLMVAIQGVGHIPSHLWMYIVISGVLHGTYILSLSQAYNTSDISYVYPIARSAPVFVPLFAWIGLEETLPFTSIIAIVLILLAVYILHFKGELLSGFRNTWDALLHKDLRWAFITLALVVSYSLVDKQAMTHYSREFPDRHFANGIEFFFLEATLGFILCNAYLFCVHPAAEIVRVWKNEKTIGFLAGIATVGSYGLICVVLQFEAVSQVVAVRQVSVLMVVLWGVIKLKESFGPQRILASILIVLGVGLMALE